MAAQSEGFSQGKRPSAEAKGAEALASKASPTSAAKILVLISGHRPIYARPRAHARLIREYVSTP